MDDAYYSPCPHCARPGEPGEKPCLAAEYGMPEKCIRIQPYTRNVSLFRTPMNFAIRMAGSVLALMLGFWGVASLIDWAFRK